MENNGKISDSQKKALRMESMEIMQGVCGVSLTNTVGICLTFLL